MRTKSSGRKAIIKNGIPVIRQLFVLDLNRFFVISINGVNKNTIFQLPAAEIIYRPDQVHKGGIPVNGHFVG